MEIEVPASPSVPPSLHPSYLPGSVGWEGAMNSLPSWPADGAGSDRSQPAQPSQAGANKAERRDHGARITFHTSPENHFSPDPSRQIKCIVVLKPSYSWFVWALMILIIGAFQEDFAVHIWSV